MKQLIICLILWLTISINLTAQSEYHFPDTLHKKRLYTTIGTITGTYIAGLSSLQYIWYADKEREPFHLYDDSQGWLQTDKFGHAFSAYHTTYTTYTALRWSGMKKKKAIFYAGITGMAVMTPIEIYDGLYEGYGFSWSDMVANTLGIMLFTSQAGLFNEQVFVMKFSQSPSIYPKYHDYLGTSYIQQFVFDYNSHTYWFSGNLKSIMGYKNIPKWLNIAIGYSANGMIYEFENPEYYKNKPFPDLQRHRQFLLSLDVDFSRIPTRKNGSEKDLKF